MKTSQPPEDLHEAEPAPEAEGVQTAKRAKRDNRVATRVFGLLVLLTALIVAANWLDLSVKRGRKISDYYVAFASTSPGTIAFSAQVYWQQSAAVQPEFFLEGKKLPCRLEVPPTEGQVRRLSLTWRVPRQCTPGLHRGILKLEPAGAGETARVTSQQFPITLGVMSFWQQWWMTSLWLGFVGICYIVSYPFFLWWRPAPKGRLCIQQSNQMTPVEVFLRPRRIGWLMPWLRSELSLRWISRQGGGFPILDTVDGSFIFDRFFPNPIFELQSADGHVRWLEKRQRTRLAPTHGIACGLIQQLYPWGTLVIWDVDRKTSVAIWFEQAGAG